MEPSEGRNGIDFAFIVAVLDVPQSKESWPILGLSIFFAVLYYVLGEPAYSAETNQCKPVLKGCRNIGESMASRDGKEESGNWRRSGQEAVQEMKPGVGTKKIDPKRQQARQGTAKMSSETNKIGS